MRLGVGGMGSLLEESDARAYSGCSRDLEGRWLGVHQGDVSVRTSAGCRTRASISYHRASRRVESNGMIGVLSVSY